MSYIPNEKLVRSDYLEAATPTANKAPVYYESIQVLRGIAASLVVLYHCITIMNPISRFRFFGYGEYGVDIFFVISGFIMTVTTVSQTSVRRFFVRRLVRIVPLYWFITILTFIVALLLPSAFRSLVPTFSDLLQSLLFIPHYSPGHPEMIWPLVNQGWTLNIEIFFYILFGAFLFLGYPAHLVGVIASLSGLAILGIFASSRNPFLNTYLSSFLIEFVYGMILGRICVRGAPVGFLIYGCGGIFILLVARLTGLDSSRVIWYGGLSAVLVCASLAVEKFGHLRPPYLFLLIGEASYSIYLTNNMALGIVRLFGRYMHVNWRNAFVDVGSVALGLALALVGGAASYLAIERPCVKFLSGIFKFRT